MSIDILAVNSILAENKQLRTKIYDSTAGKFARDPNDPDNWQYLPLMSSPSGTVKVCSSDDFWGQANCTWTVPSGVTQAQFQIWGAGASTASAQCCGGDTFGGTGAYAIKTIAVTAGDTYTICAGCGSCCRAGGGGQPGYSGCDSYVNGPGLSNLCAMGGEHRLCVAMKEYNDGCARFQKKGCTDSGPCSCAAGNYCFDNSCSTCGEIEPFPSEAVKAYGADFYIPGMHGGGCLDTNGYGYLTTCMIITENHTPFAGNSCLCFSSGNCGGVCCSANSGWNKHPGMGGIANKTQGGTCWCGDSGRAGMVKVSYK